VLRPSACATSSAFTGDPIKLGNYPDATEVFDVDSIGLVNIAQRLNHGLDIGANSIGASTNFTVGVGRQPPARPTLKMSCAALPIR